MGTLGARGADRPTGSGRPLSHCHATRACVRLKCMTITTDFLPFLADAAIGTPINRVGVSFFPVYFPGR